MHWVVQDGMYNEAGYRALCDALIRMDVPHTFVQPIPFTAEFNTEPVVENPVMVCGAMTMIRIAKARGWTPGAFFNDHFRFESWHQNYGEHLFNADARVSRFDQVEEWWPRFFIRPCEDSKSFSGQVMAWSDFADWRKQVVAIPEEDRRTLRPETMVITAGIKSIFREYRFFIVDGRIVDGSQYKRGDQVIHDRQIDADILDFTARMATRWGPDRAYCLDIALGPDGPKVLEINCINSAGFYAIDPMRFIDAIENMGY